MAVTAESSFALLDLARSERSSNLSKGRLLAPAAIAGFVESRGLG
jgi:hypothetical protein